MEIQQLTVGTNYTNCYILYDRQTLEASVIDPGGDAVKILGFLKSNLLNLKNIFLTHGHFDHILGVEQLKEATNARVVIHKLDAPCLSDSCTALYYSIMSEPFRKTSADVTLVGGEKTLVCGKEMTFIHTPGHSAGSMCLFLDDIIFSGDTLFEDTIGRYDFPTSSESSLSNSLRYLYGLNNDYRILPGHGNPTTLFKEKVDNREFLRMVGQNWL